MQLVIRDEVTAVLDELGARRKNKQIAQAIGLAVVGLTIRSFNDPSVRAAPWAPLSPETIERKLAEGTSTAILKRHSLLFRSWRVLEATSDFVRVGSDRFYALFHQFGTSGRVPARPMLPMTGGPEGATLTPLAVRRMVEVARAALEGIFRRGRKSGQQ
jgi:phage gpG-like protein